MLLAFTALLATKSSATITVVQKTDNWSFVGTGGGTCSLSNVGPCALTFSAPLTVGNIVGVCYGAQSATAPAQTSIALITGGSSNWKLNPTDAFGNSVEGYSSGQGHSTTCAYGVVSVADTVLQVTRSGSGSNWFIYGAEVHVSSPDSISLSYVGNVSSLSPSGGTYFYNGPVFNSITGNNAIIAVVSAGAQETSCNSPYANWLGVDHDAACIYLNTTVGTGAVFNSNQSAGYASSGMVFLETVTPPPGPPSFVVRGGVKFKGGVRVNAPALTLQITSTSPLPNCTQSTPFSYTFNASGGILPYTWTKASGTLQPGLSLSSAGVLSGSCSNNTGTDTATIQVCDSSAVPQCVQGSFAQTAQSSPPPTLGICDSISSPTCPNPPATGVVGTFYSYNFSAIGGTAPYTWTVSSGSLPLGLSLTGPGVFAGFPSTPGTYSFTAEVTDSTMPTPATATANFSVSISGFNGNPAVAVEPQSWVTAYQGGQNLSTGNPCTQSDATGACARNLPKVCDSGHNCVHEQLGFGTNDHPATILGLYQAGCDWTALAQNKYLWVEVKKTSVLTNSSLPLTTALFGNPNALYVSPVKMDGLATPMPPGTTPCAAATNTPIGPYSLAGAVTSGAFQLGEQFCQQTSNACANLLYVTCTLGTGANEPWRHATTTVLPNCSDAGDSQTGPFALGMFTGGTPDSNNAHLWIGQTSGSVFTQSAIAATNGYFRLTTECDDADTNIPCNGLADQVPCFHSLLDSSLLYQPLCANDLPSMFTIEASLIGVSSSNQIEQDGENTSLSGFEVTFKQGQNQSGPNQSCPPGVQCSLSPQLLALDCGACGFDHIWAHGWDMGDPALHPGDPSQLSFASGPCPSTPFTNPCYPVTPGTSPAQYNCPSWAYYTTNPPSTANPPLALASSNPAPYNQVQYANGCGDDTAGVSYQGGGYTWGEYFVVNKIHKMSSEDHNLTVGNAATNLNPNGAGINGPFKLSQFYMGTSSIGLFFGGSAIQPISGVALDGELRAFRISTDPGYRYLTSNAGKSPQAAGGYGCGQGPSGGNPQAQICPLAFGMKKNLEVKWLLRGLFDGWNIENMWPDGQTGEISTIDARVCSGGDVCGIFLPDGTPITQTSDITLSNCIVRNAAGGITFAPRSGTAGNGGGISQGMDRVKWSNCLMYNLDQNQFGGSKGGDLTNYGVGGNQYMNGKATRSGGIASITFDVGTVAPNPLSTIQLCGTDLGGCTIPPSQGGGTLANGTLYVAFNSQREDPISPQTCVGGVCTPGITGPCFNTDGVTVIPCGTMVFSGGPYDATWNSLTGAGAQTGGALTSVTADGDGTGYFTGQYTVVQGTNQSAIIQVAATTGAPNHTPTAWTIINPGSGYTSAGFLQLNPPSGTGDSATVTVTASAIATVPVFDCRTLPCSNTQGTTNIWAPLCNAGQGATTAEIGAACHNCGASGNSQCPPFGCGDASCVTGSEFGTDAICVGTGKAPGCGPANATFQTYGFSITDISPGDIVYVQNCSDASFNSPPSGYPGTSSYACSAGMNGCAANNNPASLTVKYPQPGLPDVASGVTSCQINNGAGWQRNFIIDHFAFYTGGKAQVNASLFGIATQPENNQLTNSIFWFGTNGNGIFCAGSGCKNQEANENFPKGSSYQSWDVNTNQIHHNAFILPTTLRASYYTAVGNVGSHICNFYDTPGNCTEWLNGSTKTPIALNCTTSQGVDANGIPVCLGLKGFLTSTFPTGDCTSPTLSLCPLISPPYGSFDYHNLALCPTCRSGGANYFASQGSDGLQLGPCLASGSGSTCTGGGQTVVSIDNAMTRTKYVCTGSCGTGPWAD